MNKSNLLLETSTEELNKNILPQHNPTFSRSVKITPEAERASARQGE